uniref:Putative secreted protein n=1 Tax=Anopheles darlingi TaxID=43151 RepID=A0A2M4DRJ0_ANODA
MTRLILDHRLSLIIKTLVSISRACYANVQSKIAHCCTNYSSASIAHSLSNTSRSRVVTLLDHDLCHTHGQHDS